MSSRREAMWLIVMPTLCVLAVMAWSATTFTLQWVTRPGPPLQFTDVEVMSPIVQPKGDVNIRYTVNRDRLCPSLINGFVVDPATDRAVLRFDPLFGGYGTVGQDQRILVLRPAPMEPGRYCYRSTSVHWCDTQQFTTQAPDACFTVENG